MQPLSTTRDIEDGSGCLVPVLVQASMSEMGEDQEFSDCTRHIGNQNVYTAALVCWNRRRPVGEAADGRASGSVL